MTVRLVIMSFLCLHVPESITNQFICKYIYLYIHTGTRHLFSSCSGLFEGEPPCAPGFVSKPKSPGCVVKTKRVSSCVRMNWTVPGFFSTVRFWIELGMGRVSAVHFEISLCCLPDLKRWWNMERWTKHLLKAGKKGWLRQPPLIFGSFQDRAEAKCHPFSWRCNRLQRLNKNTLRDEEILSTWSCKDGFTPIFSRDGHGPCQKSIRFSRTAQQYQPTHHFFDEKKDTNFIFVASFRNGCVFFLCCRNSSSHLAIFVLSSLDLVTSLSPPSK